MGEIKEGETLNSPLNSHGLEIRKYQVKIAGDCVNKNSLVVLPTGLGKTIIAVLVASKILETFPPHSKIIVLAPTRPLINQHQETFSRFLNIPEDQHVVLTGKIPPENRKELFNDNQILFYTPQTLRNDLVNEKYTLKSTALIVFDEAHHTTGDYPYTMIADKFIDHNPDGIILGLTASPGASKKKIDELCRNLHVPIENIHIRTRKDKDVKSYIKPMDIYKIGVDMTNLMEDVHQLLALVLEERLQYLSRMNFLKARDDQSYKRVIRKDLLRLNAELVGLLKNNGDKTGVYSALSINAQGLILYHMLELVEQQGLDVLLVYLEKLNKDARKKNSSKASKVLASDGRIRKVYLELKRNLEFSPENLIHPKYLVLVKIINEELDHDPSSRILIFVKLRNSVKNITDKLTSIPIIKPVRFVGQATKSEADKGLSQKQQIEILDQFKKGLYNVLVSTNVGEEGLDIAECDLVIFYDVVASEIRFIQRKGRTARHREGKVIILYCKGTRDEIYLRIALNKLKRMNINLKNPQQLKESYEYKKQGVFLAEATIQQDVPESQFQGKSMASTPKKPMTRHYQSKLMSFIEGTGKEGKTDGIPIKISKLLPMKFGLRKRFQLDGIPFNSKDTNLHVVIHEKVLIQVYDPKTIAFDELIIEVKDLQQICSLLIVAFDFIDFKEGIEGEKRVIKRKIQNLASNHGFRAITIDNEEELYFIIKNILEYQKE
ncbi:MAG: DEAD/DEAH box helicase family protein [Candidatus Helarchaeota archaeon]|nr:DEAD/DEAH box helicase family protein [Candidatus Helarchaeota archaeon]